MCIHSSLILYIPEIMNSFFSSVLCQYCSLWLELPCYLLCLILVVLHVSLFPGGISEPPERTVLEGYVVDWGDWQKFWIRVGSAGDAQRCQRDSTCLKVRSAEAGKTWQFQEGEFYDWEKQPLVTHLLLAWFAAISYGQFRWLQSELSGSYCNINFLDHNVICKQSSGIW